MKKTLAIEIVGGNDPEKDDPIITELMGDNLTTVEMNDEWDIFIDNEWRPYKKEELQEDIIPLTTDPDGGGLDLEYQFETAGGLGDDPDLLGLVDMPWLDHYKFEGFI